MVDRISAVRLIDGGLGGISLTEAAVIDPYAKDYDAIEGSGPTCWPERFDVSDWGSSAPAGTARGPAVP